MFFQHCSLRRQKQKLFSILIQRIVCYREYFSIEVLSSVGYGYAKYLYLWYIIWFFIFFLWRNSRFNVLFPLDTFHLLNTGTYLWKQLNQMDWRKKMIYRLVPHATLVSRLTNYFIKRKLHNSLARFFNVFSKTFPNADVRILLLKKLWTKP